MAQVLSGKAVADSISENLVSRVEALLRTSVTPCLAMIRVGENDADLSYERNAVRRCEKIGIKVVHFNLASQASGEDILAAVRTVNEDSSIHACLIFRPLPDKDIENEAAKLLDPAKDVDCMTPVSLMSVFLGRDEGFSPCTPAGCMEILDHYNIELSGKNVVIIGRSPVVGKPLAMLLQNRNATVTMCHTKTHGIAEISKAADILAVAAGHAGTVNESFVNDKQIIVDVGTNLVYGKLCGDVDFNACEPLVAAITPVPGGVGSVTTSVLAKHVVEACENQQRARKAIDSAKS